MLLLMYGIWNLLVNWEKFAYLHSTVTQIFVYSLSRRYRFFHPIMRLRWRVCIASFVIFVRISASMSFVDTGWISRVPFITLSRKWWYFVLICLVRGRIFGDFALVANSIAPLLSSNTRQNILGAWFLNLQPFSGISAANSSSGRTSLVAADIARYSLSVVDSAI